MCMYMYLSYYTSYYIVWLGFLWWFQDMHFVENALFNGHQPYTCTEYMHVDIKHLNGNSVWNGSFYSFLPINYLQLHAMRGRRHTFSILYPGLTLLQYRCSISSSSSYVDTHGLFVNNVCLNLQNVPWGRVYSIHTFNKSVHRSNSVQVTGFSPTLKIWSQKPQETISEIENLKIFPGEHAPRPP